MTIGEVYGSIAMVAAIALFVGSLVAMVRSALYEDEDEKEKYKNEG